MSTDADHRAPSSAPTATFDRAVARVGPTTVRWLLGLLWLSNVDWKVPLEFGSLRGFTAAGVEHPVLPGSAWVFEQIVLPRMSTFGWVTLFVEAGLAAALLSGRFLRIAGVVSAAQAIGIGLAVANAPNEWYWAYLLMIGLSVAVLVEAPRVRPPSPRTTAVVVAVYGVAIALNRLLAGRIDGGDATTVFTGGNDIPDELANAIFAGSVGLGVGFVAVAIAAWFVSGTDARLRTVVGSLTIGAAAVLLLTYRSDPDALAIGLGARASHCAVLAAVGLSLLPLRRSHDDDAASVEERPVGTAA